MPRSPIAVVRVEGVGEAYDAAKSFPVTWEDVANVPPESRVSVKPVRPVAEIGLTPIAPATMV